MEHLQSVQNESLEVNPWRVVFPRLDFPLKSRFVIVVVLNGHLQNFHETTTATFCAAQCSLHYCRCAQGCPSVLPVQLKGLQTSLSKTAILWQSWWHKHSKDSESLHEQPTRRTLGRTKPRAGPAAHKHPSNLHCYFMFLFTSKTTQKHVAERLGSTYRKEILNACPWVSTCK